MYPTPTWNWRRKCAECGNLAKREGGRAWKYRNSAAESESDMAGGPEFWYWIFFAHDGIFLQNFIWTGGSTTNTLLGGAYRLLHLGLIAIQILK